MRWNDPRRRRHQRRCLPHAAPRHAAWLRQGPEAPPPQVSEPGYRLKNLYSRNLAVHHFESPFDDRTEFPEPARPVHVSVGPQRAHAVVVMLEGQSRRRVPRKLDADRFLLLDVYQGLAGIEGTALREEMNNRAARIASDMKPRTVRSPLAEFA